MGIFDRVGEFMSLGVAPKPVALPDPTKLPWKTVPELIAENQTQTRAIDSYTSYPGLEAQLLAIQGLTDRPWRYPGINEALGTPAIFRAVSLIANTTGSLAVEAYRRGVKLSDEETPRVIKRPDPFTIPRNFYRDSAYFLATRGECWWWVGARDTDGLAMSLICVPPWEITIEATDDRLRPKILWLNREMRREDMRHLTFLRDDSGYRGVGPLQLCGAAISVAVEAQNWAANFYADGGYPSIVIKSATELGQNEAFGNAQAEADALRAAWVARDSNTPRVIDPGIESIEQFNVDESSAAALQGRNANDGDAARMFGIPGALLEYASSGSSLTYQNVAEVYRQFVQTCLAPNYLEPIEQELSDLLPRTTVARFNIKGLLRADIKTRFETYQIGIEQGIFTAETAAAEEGYLPGDVEFAPIPFSEPSAVPTKLPIQLRTQGGEVRCDGTRLLKGLIKPCNAKLAEQGPFTGNCWRCGKTHQAAA
jgi:HK97 family phage portal protein